MKPRRRQISVSIDDATHARLLAVLHVYDRATLRTTTPTEFARLALLWQIEEEERRTAHAHTEARDARD